MFPVETGQAATTLFVTEEFVKQLATRFRLRVVFLDGGFTSNCDIIIAQQIFKLMVLSTEIKHCNFKIRVVDMAYFANNIYN